jgi:hypothetical protein
LSHTRSFCLNEHTHLILITKRAASTQRRPLFWESIFLVWVFTRSSVCIGSKEGATANADSSRRVEPSATIEQGVVESCPAPRVRLRRTQVRWPLPHWRRDPRPCIFGFSSLASASSRFAGPPLNGRGNAPPATDTPSQNVRAGDSWRAISGSAICRQ